MKTVEQVRKEYPDFKSPKKLGITDEEYCALNEVREGLCEGRYVHTPDYRNTTGPNIFHMSMCFVQTNCGTVGCIGGWMAHVMHPHWSEFDKASYVGNNEHNTNLSGLFYPRYSYSVRPWSKLTPQKAALACANFLKGNINRPWDGV